MEKELTIIIPTYNRASILVRTLKAINEQKYNLKNIEVIVVDDCSKDNPKKDISKVRLKYNLRFYRMKKNAGQGMVRNFAIDKARGKYLFFIGDDTIPDKMFLNEHMKIHKKNRGLAVLGKVLWAKEVRNEFMNFIEGIQFHYDNIKDKNNVKMHFYTSNISLEKKWFDNEKYSNNFNNYGLEDLELGYRLENKGLRVIYNPLAKVYHVHSYNFEQFCERMRKVGRSAVIFIQIHPELKRKYIPRLMGVYKLGSFILSRKLFKSINKKIYWYSRFVYEYIEGVQEK